MNNSIWSARVKAAIAAYTASLLRTDLTEADVAFLNRSIAALKADRRDREALRAEELRVNYLRGDELVGLLPTKRHRQTSTVPDRPRVKLDPAPPKVHTGAREAARRRRQMEKRNGN